MLATPLQYSHTLLGVSSSFGSAISNNVACVTYHILSPFICFHLTQQCQSQVSMSKEFVQAVSKVHTQLLHDSF